MLVLVLVALGGAAGAVARYAFAGWVYDRARSAFPWGTLAVNVSGSFLLGCALPLLAAEPALTPLRAFVTVGCIGAFTTFSTFAYEAAMLLEERDRRAAATYVAASLAGGLASLWMGLAAAGALARIGG